MTYLVSNMLILACPAVRFGQNATLEHRPKKNMVTSLPGERYRVITDWIVHSTGQHTSGVKAQVLHLPSTTIVMA